jgi:hypothetical protein
MDHRRGMNAVEVEARVGVVVEALRYKPEGREFETG